MASRIPHTPADNIYDRLAYDVKKAFDSLHQVLIKRREQLLGEIVEMRAEHAAKEEERNNTLLDLERLKSQLNKINFDKNKVEQLQINALDPIENEIEKMSKMVDTKDFTFDTGNKLEELKLLLEQFGTIREKTEGEYLASFANPLSKKKNPCLKLGISDEKALNSSKGIAIDENKQCVYIADCGNHYIQVLSFSGIFLRQIGENILIKPWGVACYKNNIYVTDNDLQDIANFDSQTGELIKCSEDGKNLQLINIHGITVDVENGDVYVANIRTHSIFIFSSDLEIKFKKFGKPNLNFPYDVIVTASNVIVLDWSEPSCVHIFTRIGDLIKSIISHLGNTSSSCNHPCFLTKDSEDNYIISDTKNNCVKVFSVEGNHIYTIGTETETEERKMANQVEDNVKDRTYGIAVSSCGIIFVIRDRKECVLELY